MSDEPKYYTVEEVAARFRLRSAYHVERNKKRWPHIRIAGQTLFTDEHIRVIAEKHLVDPEAPVTSEDLAAGRITRGRRPASP